MMELISFAVICVILTIVVDAVGGYIIGIVEKKIEL